ncbi:MAG: hypothetical protein AB7S75_24635 [Desulfococcaceae bacterium]
MISINDYTVFRRAGTAFCARRPAETAGTKSRAHPAMMVHFFMEIALDLLSIGSLFSGIAGSCGFAR